MTNYLMRVGLGFAAGAAVVATAFFAGQINSTSMALAVSTGLVVFHTGINTEELRSFIEDLVQGKVFQLSVPGTSVNANMSLIPAPPAAASPAAAPSVPVATTVSNPINPLVLQQLLAGSYDVYPNPNYTNGLIYGVASPAGYTYFDTYGNPILTLAPGQKGSPAGTGSKILVPGTAG